MNILALYNYWVVIILMMAGLYIMIARHNLVKKMIGLSIFQTSIFYLYISMGKVKGGTAPILLEMPGHGHASATDWSDALSPIATAQAADGAAATAAATTVIYSNPLPHVLILTAIVVGVATTAVGLALIVRINEEYGTIEEDELRALEQKDPA